MPKFIDGSVPHKSTHGGFGFIIRDSAGQGVVAGAGHIQHILNPLQAEAMACLKTLHAAQQLEMVTVLVEMDSTDLLHAINGMDQDRSAIGVIFKEIRSFASLNFSHFEIMYCTRGSLDRSSASTAHRGGAGHLGLAFSLDEAPGPSKKPI